MKQNTKKNRLRRAIMKENTTRLYQNRSNLAKIAREGRKKNGDEKFRFLKPKKLKRKITTGLRRRIWKIFSRKLKFGHLELRKLQDFEDFFKETKKLKSKKGTKPNVKIIYLPEEISPGSRIF